MTNIDTIMNDGKIDRKSALHSVVYGVIILRFLTHYILNYKIIYDFFVH